MTTDPFGGNRPTGGDSGIGIGAELLSAVKKEDGRGARNRKEGASGLGDDDDERDRAGSRTPKKCVPSARLLTLRLGNFARDFRFVDRTKSAALRKSYKERIVRMLEEANISEEKAEGTDDKNGGGGDGGNVVNGATIGGDGNNKRSVREQSLPTGMTKKKKTTGDDEISKAQSGSKRKGKANGDRKKARNSSSSNDIVQRDSRGDGDGDGNATRPQRQSKRKYQASFGTTPKPLHAHDDDDNDNDDDDNDNDDDKRKASRVRAARTEGIPGGTPTLAERTTTTPTAITITTARLLDSCRDLENRCRDLERGNAELERTVVEVVLKGLGKKYHARQLGKHLSWLRRRKSLFEEGTTTGSRDDEEEEREPSFPEELRNELETTRSKLAKLLRTHGRLTEELASEDGLHRSLLLLEEEEKANRRRRQSRNRGLRDPNGV